MQTKLTRKKLNINFEGQQDVKSEKSEQSAAEHSQSNDSTFPFNKTISNLLYVYGDQRRTNVQDLAHLQIQELISQLFHPTIIRSLYQKPRNPWSDCDDTDSFTFPTMNARNKKILQSYLFSVFREFVIPYQKLSKNLSKVERSVAQNEDLYEKALQKKSQMENLHIEEEAFSQSEEISQEFEAQAEVPKIVWENYMKTRVENMNRKEFIKFMELRSKTFISNKNFKKLIDVHQYGQHFLEAVNQKFLNYCLCKILRKAMQTIFELHYKQEGIFVVNEAQLKQHGYEMVNQFVLRAKKYALQDQKLTKMAYNLFQKEFIQQGYDAFFQLKFKLNINGTFQSNQQTRAKDEWIGMGSLRLRWIDRIKAEKQVKQVLVKNKQVKPNNSYTLYLLEQLNKCSYEEAKLKFPVVFKNWFINYDVDLQQIDSIYD